jgi:hypothetical protein
LDPADPKAGSTGEKDGRSMRWFVGRCGVAIACALATVAPATLAAQETAEPAETRYDTSVVAVRGNGPTTFVLLSGMVGGVSGFRRLASLLEPDNRVVIIEC